MKLNEPIYIRVLTVTVGLVALAFLITGNGRYYDVLPDPNLSVAAPPPPTPPPMGVPGTPRGFTLTEPPMPSPPVKVGPMNEWTLVANTTFTGVTRREGQLYLTYDPAKKTGKQSCPT